MTTISIPVDVLEEFKSELKKKNFVVTGDDDGEIRGHAMVIGYHYAAASQTLTFDIKKNLSARSVEEIEGDIRNAVAYLE